MSHAQHAQPKRRIRTGSTVAHVDRCSGAPRFGAREPDISVRNPDTLAERLLTAADLQLIREHMARVLILGGAGFIGRHAWAALRARGHETVIGTRRPRRAKARFPAAGDRRFREAQCRL